MDEKEVHRKCLERRLKDEKTLKASITADLQIQDKLIEGIKEELRKIGDCVREQVRVREE